MSHFIAPWNPSWLRFHGRWFWLAACLGAALMTGCTGIVIPPAENAAAAGAIVDAQGSAPVVDAPDRNAELARQRTEEAAAHFRRSRFAEAEAAYRQALDADPESIPALTGLSDLYTYQPYQWQQALALAEKAHALAGDDGTVLAHLAWAQQMAHRFLDALDTAERAVALDPNNGLARVAYGDILLSVYRPEQALEQAERALELNEEDYLAWVLLSMIRESLHDWAGAEEAVIRARELDPDFLIWSIVHSRRDFDLRGDPELALELAADAIEALPDHPFVLGLQVDLAVELNDWEQAVAGCQGIADWHSAETPYPDGFTCLANIAMWQEDNVQAAKHQDQAEAIAWADRFDVSMPRMHLLNDADECKESRALAQKWLDVRPFSVAARRMMAIGHMCSRDFEAALEYLKPNQEQLPRSVMDARYLALAYARNDMKSEASKTLSAVRSFAFDDPLYYQALYEMNFILGDLDAAIANAQRWSVFRPQSTDAMEAIAYAHLYNGDVEAAQRTAQNAYERGARNSTVQSILGYARLLQGDFEKAEEFLLNAVAKDGDTYLTRYSLTQLYQVRDRCEDSEPHVEWLIEEADTPEERTSLSQSLEACYEARTRAAEIQENLRSDAEVQAFTEEKLTEQELDLRFFQVLERADQKALVVYIVSQEQPNSREFRREEIGAGLLLSTQLPRMESRPDALILVSGHEEGRVAMVVVTTQMAARWVRDQISDEQFLSTWRREDAANLPQDIFDSLE